MTIKLNKTYFISFITLLILEVFIATYVKGGFIRHTFGDFLVVILLYCFFKSFTTMKPIYAGLLVLGIAVVIEFLQETSLLEQLGLDQNQLAKIVLGSTFHVSDLIAYTLGIITVLGLEYKHKII
ncbi:hypothetical protein A9Q87_13585 [Flavobacteriales bacterium 34_180_T64]|nr:hypothetical protein A9Q87_13585 [Flavobacteriales bacterium 34_180_T64]